MSDKKPPPSKDIVCYRYYDDPKGEGGRARWLTKFQPSSPGYKMFPKRGAIPRDLIEHNRIFSKYTAYAAPSQLLLKSASLPVRGDDAKLPASVLPLPMKPLSPIVGADAIRG